jgi:cytochrome P450
MHPEPIEETRYWGRSVLAIRCPRLAHEILALRHDVFVKNFGNDRWRARFGDVLLTNDGARHAQQKAQALPLFQSPDSADSTIHRWACETLVELSRENCVPPRSFLAELALRSQLFVLTGADLRDEVHGMNRALARLLGAARPEWLSLAERLGLMSLPDWARFLSGQAAWNRSCQRAIEAAEPLRAGMLSRLRFPRKLPISPELNTVFAGYETTAYLLESSLRVISANASLRKRLTEEARRAEGIYPSLRLTKNVVLETLRLHPPIKSIRRFAATDTSLSGRPIKRGTLVLVQWESIQRHPDYFTDPERFDPNRWEDSAAGDSARLAFFPFGAGPHRCPGEAMARRHAALILAGYSLTAAAESPAG